MALSRKTKPPIPADVATRAIVLKYLVVYALTVPPREALQPVMQGWSDGERQQYDEQDGAFRDDFWSGLGSLRSALSPWERSFSSATSSTMSQQQQVDATWRVESFQVLVWALGILPKLPPYSAQADHELLKAFPPDGCDPVEFIRAASLLAAQRIASARNRAELWHWRSRTYELMLDGQALPDDPELRSAGFESYDDVVRFTVEKMVEQKSLPRSIDGDFPVRGKAYRDLTREEWATVSSITTERHFALNWLCGLAPANRWDDTPTDT
jgi:hypothetical protein